MPDLRSAHPTPWLHVFGAALVAVLHAVVVLGRLHPDEVYQSLEPALHRAFGYGVLAWEWQVGLRNQAIPITFAALLKGAHALGIDSVLGRRIVLAVPQWALHAAMLAAVFRLTSRRVGPTLATASMWLVALYPPVVWFGARTMSESFSVAFLVWGLERLDDSAARSRSWLWGGVLLGLAEVTRYGSAAAIVPAMLWLLVTRRWAAAAWAAGGGLAVAAALGALDWMTWGHWFHSLRAYVDFNVFSGQASQKFGASPLWYYFPLLWVGPWAVIGLVSWWWQRPARCGLFVASALGYLLAISLTPHKEARFLYPTLVLLTVAGTGAFSAWMATRWRNGTAARLLAGVTLALTGVLYTVPNPFKPERAQQFQLELKAAKEATGLVVMNEGLWGAGGFFYLGKDIPWCVCDFPQEACFQMAQGDSRFNRAVYWSNGVGSEARDAQSKEAFERAGFRVLEVRGPATLFGRP